MLRRRREQHRVSNRETSEDSVMAGSKKSMLEMSACHDIDRIFPYICMGNPFKRYALKLIPRQSNG